MTTPYDAIKDVTPRDAAGVGIDGTDVVDQAWGQDGLIFYVFDLEALVRWLALTFSYEDPTTGERIVNDPIWATVDQFGHPLEDAVRLKTTWDKVMHPGEDAGSVPRETLPPGSRDLIPGEEAPMG